MSLCVLQYQDPPYAISHANQRLPLSINAIGVTAQHLDGQHQYNTHNLFGLSEAAATATAVGDITGRRPFLLSRSVDHALLLRFRATLDYAFDWHAELSLGTCAPCFPSYVVKDRCRVPSGKQGCIQTLHCTPPVRVRPKAASRFRTCGP